MKRKYERQYRAEWEQNLLFSKWLTKSSEGDNAFCKACNCKILPRIASLKEHEASAKHHKNSKGFSGTPQISQHFKNMSISEEVKKAEIMIVAALVEHNIPFRTMDHISEIISKAFHDSEIAKKFSCKRTKAAAVAYNVLGANFEEKIRDELVKDSKSFSIIIDESTDVSTTKMLAIAVKFYSSSKHKVKTIFLCLIDIEGETAQHLFNALNSALVEKGLDWKNMIGFAADTTNVMFGEHAGIVAKMKEVNPHCLYVKCVCHSVALAISHACKLLPRSLEQLVRDVYNYFSQSSKRQREFAEFQDFTQTEHHRLLRHYDIRWLSLSACVNRILEQWNPLKLYFQGQFLEDMRQNISSEFLYNCFNDEYLKLYLNFLDYILPLTNKFNTIFQGDYPVVHRLYNDIKGMFLALLSCYMKSAYVRGTDLKDIDPKATMHFLPLNNLYLGVNVGKHLQTHKDKMTQQQIHDFFTRCQTFLIDLCSQLKARLPTDRIFEELTFLNPQTAVYAEFKSLAGVVTRFPNLVPENLIQSIDSEFREMKFDDQVLSLMSSSSSASVPAIDVEKFWEEISKLSKYENISKFAKNMLILPVSNVKCERIFSEINRIKTNDRNRFSNKNVASILHARQGVTPCTDFVPDSQMLKCMTDKILYKDIKYNKDTEE